MQLDLDVLPDEDRDFVTSVRNGARSIEDGLYYLAPDDPELLHRIVTFGSPYRNVVLEWLELRCDDECLLNYVPDHGILEIDVTAVEGLEEINNELERSGAAVVSEQSVPAWQENGAQVSIEPPSVCVGRDAVSSRTCFSLADVDSVAVDHNPRTIELSWENKGGSLPQRAIGAVFERLGDDRPGQVTFASETEWQAAVSLFESLPDVTVNRHSVE
ncbi:hypothetical protein HFX_0075 [Haloferax mediterranei ATCC 33500]|uniref:Uncharacterized protein n=1 Tax=Haloferax mediterranei (strain ATCC 33500 / DSM 1411 / JCM 8866 / NBRC 14739 / NCIMB 2177 / R-4) TaxID=523841 RepID=I3R0Q7_HALMT|nr:hypothetical protein HFX_0075 [Haloferax mediterranei ATCC 33500]